MTPKNTFFRQKKTINCKGQLFGFDSPKVMGIINVTPDSFYAGSREQQLDAILRKAEQMLQEGADFLDIGGYSSRPHAIDISVDEELSRVCPAIEAIHQQFPKALISIDTFRSKVAQEAIGTGAHIINDISAGKLDEQMLDTVAALHVPYIIMHMQGTPQTMQDAPQYTDAVQEIFSYFATRIALLKSKGIADIIIDPGFGFGKTIAHNYELLNHLEHFQLLELPILAGLSRKSMLYKVTGDDATGALSSTIAANTIALMNGASILRVHDVKPAVDAIKIVSQLKS